MVLLQKFGEVSWKSLVILTSMIYLSGCSGLIPEAEIKTVTKIEQVTVPIVARPKPLQLSDTRVFVVTAENYEEFKKEFTELYGELVFVALSMKDYELLALNIADLRRFLNQQKQIIVYYEEAVKPKNKQEK